MVHEIAKANTGHEPIQLNVRQYNFLKYKNTREFHTTIGRSYGRCIGIIMKQIVCKI